MRAPRKRRTIYTRRAWRETADSTRGDREYKLVRVVRPVKPYVPEFPVFRGTWEERLATQVHFAEYMLIGLGPDWFRMCDDGGQAVAHWRRENRLATATPFPRFPKDGREID